MKRVTLPRYPIINNVYFMYLFLRLIYKLAFLKDIQNKENAYQNLSISRNIFNAFHMSVFMCSHYVIITLNNMLKENF